MAKHKSHGREASITSGRIETPVTGFMGAGVFGDPPFNAKYGDHKAPGSEMAPMTAGPRGSKSFFKSKLIQKGGK